MVGRSADSMVASLAVLRAVASADETAVTWENVTVAHLVGCSAACWVGWKVNDLVGRSADSMVASLAVLRAVASADEKVATWESVTVVHLVDCSVVLSAD